MGQIWLRGRSFANACYQSQDREEGTLSDTNTCPDGGSKRKNRKTFFLSPSPAGRGGQGDSSAGRAFSGLKYLPPNSSPTSKICKESNISQKDKHHIIPLLCGLRNNVNELTGQRQTPRHRGQTDGGQGAGGWGRDEVVTGLYRSCRTVTAMQVQHREYSQQHCSNCAWCWVVLEGPGALYTTI